ncbi:MAG: helix-turn-helix domain-containing protein [Anaerolineae bacterium]|nr:helix-turn-helix domain-containing protein [Anaerolineae bacterium]
MELMTVDEAAAELELTPQRVRQFCRDGRLGRRVGRQWVITREELESFKKIPREAGVSINPHKKSQ